MTDSQAGLTFDGLVLSLRVPPMRVRLLQRATLVCPYCIKRGKEVPLELIAGTSVIENDDVKYGVLICLACNSSFPIEDGIAIFPTTQEAKKYGSESVAQAYVLTQYRDVIALEMKAALANRQNDLTGYFSTAQPETYYDDLISLLSGRIKEGSQILDIGCAVGRLSRKLARQGGFVIGVDISLAEVKLARKLLLSGEAEVRLGLPISSGSDTSNQGISVRLDEAIPPNVEFIVADAELLPFRNGHFDVICASSVIDRVPDTDQFLKQVDRIGHDGSTLLLTSPFDFSEKYTSKDKWLGQKAFGTSEGLAEKALNELLRRHQYRLRNEANILWTHYSDRRHHSVWSVYSAVLEAWRWEIDLFDLREAIPQSLITAYQRIWAESEVFQEQFSAQQSQDAFKEMEILLVARRQHSEEIIGFCGGTRLTKNEASDYHRDAYEFVQRILGDDAPFHIKELGVLKEFTGHGIGGRLLERLLGYAKARGHHSFELITNYDNRAALSLYQRRGFTFQFDSQGLITKASRSLRVSGEEKTDFRPYLLRVDDFSLFCGSDQQGAYLEFIQPREFANADLGPIAEEISKLFGRAFWRSENTENRWSVENLMKELPDVDLVVLAFDATDRVSIGYALFERVFLSNQAVLFVDSIGVAGTIAELDIERPRPGLAFEMIRQALRRLPADTVAARTQNPALVRLLRKLNPEQIVPIDADFGSEQVKMLKTINDQVKELVNVRIDLASGVSKHAYPGLLGDYERLLPQEEIESFDNRMKQLEPSWKREAGDAVIVIARDIDLANYS